MANPDRYKKSLALFQAGDVSHLVKMNSTWLTEARPQTLMRNDTYCKAFHSIWRACETPNLESYVLHHPDGYVNGLGTITLGQTVEHPLAGRMTGNQIDMWFSESTSQRAQTAVIKALYAIASREDTIPVFAALTLREQERANALVEVLTPIGSIGEISASEGDPFGMLAGNPVQLYAKTPS